MNAIKRAIYGPDPNEQKRKCNALIRQNQRELDKQLTNLAQLETKTKTMVKGAARRNDMKSARVLAKELYNVKKQRSRLHKSKAQLNSISLQVNEAFALRKLEGSMKSSTGLMKEVNGLVRIPELMGSMSALGAELMKSGIIDEMVTDTLDNLDEEQFLDDEEAETEVDGILKEILGDAAVQNKTAAEEVPSAALKMPSIPSNEKANAVEADAEDLDSEDAEMLHSMRERLKALQN